MMLVVSIFVMLTSGCTMYKEVEVKEVLDVNITNFSSDGLTGDVQVSITNPNWYKITLKECHIDFTLDGKPLGSADLLSEIEIPKKTTSTQTFSIKATPDQLNAMMGNMIGMLFKTTYQMEGKGHIKGKALGVSKNFPVDFKETLTKEDLGF